MRFRVLGPLAALDAAGAPVDIRAAKPRALLAVLIADAGRVVPLDRIVTALWPVQPPPSATATVHSHVSALRRLLGPGAVVTRQPGYLLDAPPGEVDVLAFPALVARGGDLLAAGDADGAGEALREALALWRGEPFADLPDDPAAGAERARLVELQLLAREQLAAVHLRQGRAEQAVADLEPLVAEHPLRERLRARLVEALYAGGRQADALEVYRAGARLLRDELGIDPGPELRAVEQAVLRQDLALPPPRPVAEPAPPPARPAPPPDDRPLVGRRAERARLRSALADVTRGSGAVVVLEGEAGIGKTRLAEVATATARGQGWRTAWARCADDAGAPALWPWTQLLEQLEAPALEVPADADPDRARFELFQRLRASVQAAAEATPVLLVLDDVQAADATSLQLLTLLARHLDGVRVLAVVTARTVGEPLGPDVRECLTGLAREARAQRVQLSGLGEGDVRELLALRAAATGDERLAHEVHARTDGNPFFVVELAELLRSERQPDGARRVLPPSVREVLDRRLGLLPDATVELLRLAALIGRDVDLVLVQACTGLAGADVLTALEPAVASGVLREDPAGWRWRFSHALVQETLVAGLGRARAAQLHARIAEVLQQRPGRRPEDLERLAHHWFQAVPVAGPGPARRSGIAAAEAARERLAHAEAAAHTRRVLSLQVADDDGAARSDLLVALGDDLLRSGNLQQAQDVVAEALALARELGDTERLAEAASVWGGVTLWNWRGYGVVDEPLVRLLQDLASRAEHSDPALRARLLGTLGVELAYSDRRDEGVAAATAAVGTARALGDPALLSRALNNYSVASWGYADDVERRLAASDEALALAGLPARTQFFALLHRGPLRLHLGDVDGFERDLAAATRIAADLPGPEVRPHVLYQETGRAMLSGDWARAEELAVQANDLYRETSMWGAQCCFALHQFTFRRREGRVGDVLDGLVDAGDLGIPLVQAVAVLAAVEAGEHEEARRLRRRWPHDTPQDWTTDALVAVRAELALRTDGDLAAAYADVESYAGRQIVVGTATACWGSYDLLLGRLAAARGEPGLAVRHLEQAARQAGAVRSPWQAERAQELLAGLEPARQ